MIFKPYNFGDGSHIFEWQFISFYISNASKNPSLRGIKICRQDAGRSSSRQGSKQSKGFWPWMGNITNHDTQNDKFDIYYHILSYIIIYYHILSYIIIYCHILTYFDILIEILIDIFWLWVLNIENMTRDIWIHMVNAMDLCTRIIGICFWHINSPGFLGSFWRQFWGNESEESAILTRVAEVTRLRVDGFTIRSLAAWFDGHPDWASFWRLVMRFFRSVHGCPEACSCQIHPSKVVWNTPSLECRCDPLGGELFWSTDVHGLWPWCCGEVADGPGTEMNRQMRRRRHQVKGRNFYILLYTFIATFLPWRHVWKQSNDTWILWERLTLSSMCRAEQTEILPIS